MYQALSYSSVDGRLVTALHLYTLHRTYKGGYSYKIELIKAVTAIKLSGFLNKSSLSMMNFDRFHLPLRSSDLLYFSREDRDID